MHLVWLNLPYVDYLHPLIEVAVKPNAKKIKAKFENKDNNIVLGQAENYSSETHRALNLKTKNVLILRGNVLLENPMRLLSRKIKMQH
jgi:hypothetical protein